MNNIPVKRLFAAAIFLHVVFWTFAPPLFMSNYRPDTMEMMVIGQNDVLSTYKHPAFQGWFVEMLGTIFHNAEFVPYMAAQIACVITVFFTWRLATQILPTTHAYLAALSLLSYYYLHFDSTLYNNRTFMRSFWVIAVYFLFLALKSNKYRYWILTGLALGLGIYCKLTIFLLVASILIYMVWDSKARRYWSTPGPYLSTLTCFLIFIPLLIWMIKNNFPLLSHMNHSIGDNTPTFSERIISPLRFLLEQLPSLFLLLLPLYPVLGFRWKLDANKLKSTFEGRFLMGIISIPLVLQLIIAFCYAGDMRTALGCHLWLFLPIFLLYSVKSVPERERFVPLGLKIVFVNIFLFAVVSIILVQLSPLITGRASRYHFPGEQLAEQVNRIWHERYSSPLPFVRGDDWPTSCVAVYSHPTPTVYSELWSNEKEFAEKGGILLWMEPDPNGRLRHTLGLCYGNRDFYYSHDTKRPDQWLKKFPQAEILPRLEIPNRTTTKTPDACIGIAIVPPERCDQF